VVYDSLKMRKEEKEGEVGRKGSNKDTWLSLKHARAIEQLSIF